MRQHQSFTVVGRWLLIAIASGFLLLFLVMPLTVVFFEAFSKGIGAYTAALIEPDTRAAIRLTVMSACIAVMLNLCFGLAAAWLITRFDFPGRRLLITVIDLPLAVSPVIAGMIFVLLYGSRGILGPWLDELGFKVIFAEPGIILATTFVTIPYIAREIIPLMLDQGSSEEEAALTMGAHGVQVFRYITIPNIKWAVLYGLVLCNSRAMGEFGAVSVVSGHIRGVTNTMPLQIEVLYNEYRFAAAFSVASLLTLLAVVTLVLKSLFEWRVGHRQRVDMVRL